jgi:Ran GTPase-activating protein (RanGAP) involved in mRNA processing and transport
VPKNLTNSLKTLKSNIRIKRFDIGWNGFAQDGAKAFFKTIKENETLEELDMSNNRIATEGAVYIAKALMTNQSLRILKVTAVLITERR